MKTNALDVKRMLQGTTFVPIAMKSITKKFSAIVAKIADTNVRWMYD